MSIHGNVKLSKKIESSYSEIFSVDMNGRRFSRPASEDYSSACASNVIGCSQRLLVDISICHLQVSQSVTTRSAPLSSIWRNSGAPMACEVG